MIVEALKPAEDGEGFILRLVDYFGQSVATTVTLPAALAGAEACSVTEQPRDGAPMIDGNTLSFHTRPFGIHSFRLRFA